MSGIVYLDVYIDGGCRNNGQHGAIGGAAAVIKGGSGEVLIVRTEFLPQFSCPTNQIAELTALVVALEAAIHWRNHKTHPDDGFSVKVFSDSQYVVNCMVSWLEKLVQKRVTKL
jgi:ribonuclease HI